MLASHQAYSKEQEVPLPPLYRCYETEEKSIDHAICCCPWAVQIWILAGLLHAISSSEFPTQVFLDRLRCSLDFEIARLSGNHIAYVTTIFGCLGIVGCLIWGVCAAACFVTCRWDYLSRVGLSYFEDFGSPELLIGSCSPIGYSFPGVLILDLFED